jgi:hypothetical protein
VGTDDPVNGDLARGTRGLLTVLGKAARGPYLLYASTVDGGGAVRSVVQPIGIGRSGLDVVVTGDMGKVSTILGRAMNCLDGGYLALTRSDGFRPGERTTWVWQVLAGLLVPLDGEAGWHVLQHHPTAQGGQFLSEATCYEDAWTLM